MGYVTPAEAAEQPRLSYISQRLHEIAGERFERDPELRRGIAVGHIAEMLNEIALLERPFQQDVLAMSLPTCDLVYPSPLVLGLRIMQPGDGDDLFSAMNVAVHASLERSANPTMLVLGIVEDGDLEPAVEMIGGMLAELPHVNHRAGMLVLGEQQWKQRTDQVTLQRTMHGLVTVAPLHVDTLAGNVAQVIGLEARGTNGSITFSVPQQIPFYNNGSVVHYLMHS